jgi:hypothetical protein
MIGFPFESVLVAASDPVSDPEVVPLPIGLLVVDMLESGPVDVDVIGLVVPPEPDPNKLLYRDDKPLVAAVPAGDAYNEAKPARPDIGDALS